MFCPSCRALTKVKHPYKRKSVPCKAGKFDPRPDRKWRMKLMEILKEFKSSTRGRKLVYLACLYNCEGNNDHWVYVGTTGLTSEERYRDHKKGHKAGKGWVRDYGIGLLKSYTKHLKNISHGESLKLERKIAKRLKREGYKVKGGH